MIGQPNHVIALGDFLGGRVCIEDDAGAASVQLSTKKGLRKLTGTWIDVHDRPVTFNVRRYHMVEPHQGNMWCLAAYAPQSFKRATSDVVDALKQLDFPRATMMLILYASTARPAFEGTRFCMMLHMLHSTTRPAPLKPPIRRATRATPCSICSMENRPFPADSHENQRSRGSRENRPRSRRLEHA